MSPVIAILALGPGSIARANGALPASLGIILPADRPQEIVLATNFGLLLSDDGGQSWLWTCEQGFSTGGYLYAQSAPPRRRLLAVSFTYGLVFSDDGSCSWRRAGGALAGAVASDYFVDGTNPERVVALAWSSSGGGAGTAQALYGSTDGGATFDDNPLYKPAPDVVLSGVEIARSDPDVVYLGMYRATSLGYEPLLGRSADGGRSWTMASIAAAGLGASSYGILAVDPEDPDVIYLRVSEVGMESVAVSRDGGSTFSKPLTVKDGSLTAFARLASGTVLAAATSADADGGVAAAGFRSTDGGRTFGDWTLTPQPRLLGLAERDGTLYLSADDLRDGWAIATSTDEGVTVRPLARYTDVRGIKPCAATACGAACLYEASLGVWPDGICPSTTGPRGDGGRDPTASGSGCGCSITPPATSGSPAAASALALAVVGVLRRRRRRG
jgi:MYXO-CTERM domain-containing protein